MTELIKILLEPFSFDYMIKAIWVSFLIGGICGFLSVYLILKGWSLIADALSHAVIPGVAGAYLLGTSYLLGAFLSGGLAMFLILVLERLNLFKPDAIMGIIFSLFFAIGLLITSLNPTSISIQTILFGDLLSIADHEIKQINYIIIASLIIMSFIWKTLKIIFFDETLAYLLNLPIKILKAIYFILLTICIVSALQSLGAILLVAMMITPASTAYLLTDRFGLLIIISILIGSISSMIGAYVSFFMKIPANAIIVLLQALLFLFALFLAPKYGIFSGLKTKKDVRLNNVPD